jgi:dephospho-CoA kinase
MIIGITGGIGSGKSAIARQLSLMGYFVYDTDREAKRLIVSDAQVRQQISALFGPEVYQDGVYQTHIVAKRVFEQQQSTLAELNAIVHPAVRADIRSCLASYAHKTSIMAFVECAILYEAGIDQLCDMVVAVTAPEQLRIERTIARDHTDIEKVRARMHAQDVESAIRSADIVINNDGSQSIPELCRALLHQLQLYIGI